MSGGVKLLLGLAGVCGDQLIEDLVCGGSLRRQFSALMHSLQTSYVIPSIEFVTLLTSCGQFEGLFVFNSVTTVYQIHKLHDVDNTDSYKLLYWFLFYRHIELWKSAVPKWGNLLRFLGWF